MKPGKIATGDAAAHPSRLSFFTSYRFACSSSARRAIAASSERALLAARHRLDLDDLLLLVEGRHERAERLVALFDGVVDERLLRALQVAFGRLARRHRRRRLRCVEDVLRLLERRRDAFCSLYGGLGGLWRLRLHGDVRL